MRKSRIFSVLISAILCTFISIYVQAETSIIITSYNDPSSLCKGSTINVTWIGTELSGSTTIEMSPGNGSQWITIGSVDSSILQYQWNIPEGINFGNSYRFRVTNSTISDTNNADISVLPMPIITTQMKSIDSICEGNIARLGVILADNNPLLTYQWYKDGQPIQDATDAILTINELKISDRGRYKVTIKGCIDITSSELSLYVRNKVSITMQPESTLKCPGSSITLTVSALGEHLSYQWRRNGKNLPNRNDSSYTISYLYITDTGKYDCIITGDCNSSMISKAALILMNEPPVIATNFGSKDTSFCYGTSVRLRGQGTGGQIIGYEWKKDGKIINTLDSLIVLNNFSPADTGIYSFTAKNHCGLYGAEKSVHIGIISLADIYKSPIDTLVYHESETRLKVIAAGTDLHYKWRRNKIIIPRTDSSVFTIASTQIEDSGYYDCIVYNKCSLDTSEKAFLKVIDVPPGPHLVLSTNRIDFGCISRGTSSDTIFNALMTNKGDIDLTITSMTISGSEANQFSIIAGNTPFTLKKDESKAIGFQFKAESGVFNYANVSFVSNSIIASGKVLLSGKSCFESISEKSFFFGTVKTNQQPKDTVYRICNAGSQDMTINDITVLGDPAFSLKSTLEFPQDIISGDCKDIVLTFQSQQLGQKNAELAIKSNKATYKIPLYAVSEASSDVQETVSSQYVTVHPNPASDIIVIESHYPKNMNHIQLVDALGNVTKKLSMQNNINNYHIELNVESLANGYHTVIITYMNNEVLSLPLMIAR